MVQWLRCSAAETEDASGGGKRRKGLCLEISAKIIDPQVMKINPNPATTARLIPHVASSVRQSPKT